ncbi:pilus assembly protein TadG-related protein [Promicromonospora sp. AC04]|uniref:pilus assembly protein TadG-related protein n=1 Tax=Promicromonospora sp. AC04 TaxID=2135723 RepID=UPI00130493F6|nr:pilus assembly protein TadG-related protein [Promicromonospora sp. AC04]
MTIPIVVGLLSAAVLVITMVGSATNDRREAGTAADAAALAAAQEWDEHLGVLHGLHLVPGGSSDFWGIVEEVLLTAYVRDEMYEAAEAYAERNGAELVDLDLDTDSLRVTVEVRHEDEIPVAEIHSGAEATAQIRLDGGLCQDGGGLGWLIDGECVTRPEPPNDPGEDQVDEEAPADDEDEQDEEEPWTPPEVGSYSSRIVLVG